MELEDALEIVGNGRYQKKLAFLTGLTLFSDACELMLLPFLSFSLRCDSKLSTNQSNYQFLQLFTDPDSDASFQELTSAQIASLSTSIFIGMFIGAITSGLVSDTFGRKSGCLMSCFFVAFFGILSSFSFSFEALVIFRSFVGIGVGGSSSALSLFTEFVPKSARTSGMVMFLAYFSIGSVFEVLIASMFISKGWRAFLFVSSLPSLLTLLLYPFFLPESPRFLLIKGKTREAETVLLEAMRENQRTISSNKTFSLKPIKSPRNEANDRRELSRESQTEIDQNQRSIQEIELDEMRNQELSLEEKEKEEISIHFTQSMKSIKQTDSKKSLLMGFLSPIFLLFDSTLRRTTILLCCLFCLMAFLYYGLLLLTVVFSTQQESENECEDISYSSLTVTNFAELFGLYLARYALDRFGRKNTLSIFFALFGCCIPFLSIPSSLFFRTILIFFCRAISLGFNQSLWIYTTEAYPTNIRTTGLGFTSTFARVGGAISPWISQFLFAFSPHFALFSISLISFFTSILVRFLPIETFEKRLVDVI